MVFWFRLPGIEWASLVLNPVHDVFYSGIGTVMMQRRDARMAW
jgi:hypothetical protein